MEEIQEGRLDRAAIDCLLEKWNRQKVREGKGL